MTTTAIIGSTTAIPPLPVTRITTTDELLACPFGSTFVIAGRTGNLAAHKDASEQYFITGTFGPQTAQGLLDEVGPDDLFLVFQPPSQDVAWFDPDWTPPAS